MTIYAGMTGWTGICLSLIHICIQECRTYTVNDVARILGVSTNAVYRLIPENLFRSVRIGSAIRISKRSFDHWLESLDL